jgi:hypothetical protein
MALLVYPPWVFFHSHLPKNVIPTINNILNNIIRKIATPPVVWSVTPRTERGANQFAGTLVGPTVGPTVVGHGLSGQSFCKFGHHPHA